MAVKISFNVGYCLLLFAVISCRSSKCPPILTVMPE